MSDPDSMEEWREAAKVQYRRAEAWKQRADDYITVIEACVVLLESPNPPHKMVPKVLKELINNHVTIPWEPTSSE